MCYTLIFLSYAPAISKFQKTGIGRQGGGGRRGMWSWDVNGEMRISELNGNLVVRFNDYLTGEPFYSFLGDNEVNEMAEVETKFA
ncbi:MAG: hypothetical protein V1704_04200 [Candidatus Vogelbacteria bacterium]